MKLKTTIPAAVVITLLFSSCVIETSEPGNMREVVSDGKAIGFAVHRAAGDDSPETSRQARASSTRSTIISDLSDLALSGGFDAFTYAHTGSWNTAPDADILIDNTGADYAHVTSPDGGVNWVYAGTSAVEWPAGKSVSSFAIAPHDAPGVTIDSPTGAGSVPTVRLTLPPPGPNRGDVMFAASHKNLTANSHGGTIPNTFHHALARVRFLAVKATELAGNNVIVTKITLTGVCESGTAALETPVVWTPTAGGSDPEFTAVGGELTGDPVTSGPDDEPQDLLAQGIGTLFMLPQDLSAAMMEIRYTIDGVETVKQSAIPLPAGETGWTAGGAYAILLGIRANEVVIDPFEVTFTSSDTYRIVHAGYYYIEAWGGNGGTGGHSGIYSWSGGTQNAGGGGGQGARNAGLYYLTAGQLLRVQVGRRGNDGYRYHQAAAGGSGGTATYFGAGGTGGMQSSVQNPGIHDAGSGGGGGSASGVLVDGTALSNILLAAAGGGGGGGATFSGAGYAGNNGGNGQTVTQPAGAPGKDASGPGGAGGGGGGGGGFNGTSGGGGDGGSGGAGFYIGSGMGGSGGANYKSPEAQNPNNYPVPNNSGHTQRPGNGNGFVVISYLGK